MLSVAIEKQRPAARWGLFVVIGSVGLITVIGLLLTVQAFANMIGNRGEPAAVVGGSVPTSFGFVTVTTVRSVDDFHGAAGMFTGPGSIPADKRAIQVEVTLANRTDHPAPYSSDEFALRLGVGGGIVKASEATFYSGTLRPGAVLDGQITFLVSRTSPTPLLQFSDPALADPIVIDLGPLPGADSSGHDHAGH
jgi:hypothetical protein